MKLLYKSIKFANKAHKGQTRKGLLPYIVHPIRVMETLWNLGVRDEEMLCAAVLHDVLEETKYKSRDIEDRFGINVCEMVVDLTQFNGESRDEYIARFNLAGPLPTIIKACDIFCNTRDYIFARDMKAARNYFKKRKAIFNMLFDTFDLIDVFGHIIEHNLMVEYTKLVEELEL